MTRRQGDGGKPGPPPPPDPGAPGGREEADPHDPTIRFTARELKEYERQREEEADTTPKQKAVASPAETPGLPDTDPTVAPVARDLPPSSGGPSGLRGGTSGADPPAAGPFDPTEAMPQLEDPPAAADEPGGAAVAEGGRQEETERLRDAQVDRVAAELPKTVVPSAEEVARAVAELPETVVPSPEEVARALAEPPETVVPSAEEVARALAEPTTEKLLEGEALEGRAVSSPPVSEPALELDADDIEVVEEGEDAGASEPQLWYCYVGDRIEGPYDPPALGQMLGDGLIDHATLLSGQDGTWVPLARITELEALLQGDGPAPEPGAASPSSAPTELVSGLPEADAPPVRGRRHDPTVLLPPAVSTDLPDRIGRRTAAIVLEEERTLCYEVERILGDTRLTVLEWPASRPLEFLELVGWGRSGARADREQEASPVFTAGDDGPVLLLWPWLTGELSQIGTHPVPLADLRADEAVQGIVAAGGDQIPALRFAPGDELVLSASGMFVRIRLGRVRRRPDLKPPPLSAYQLLAAGVGSLLFVVLYLLLDSMEVPRLRRCQPLEPHREMLVRFLAPLDDDAAEEAREWLGEQGMQGGAKGAGFHETTCVGSRPARATVVGVGPDALRRGGAGGTDPPGVVVTTPSDREISSSSRCLSKAAIKRILRRAGGRIRSCYERTRRGPGARQRWGRLVVELRIAPGGRVLKARLVEDTRAARLGACVLGVMRRLRFTGAQGCPSAVTLRYPLVFRPAPSSGEASGRAGRAPP